MFKEGDPKDYMISIFSELGINTQEATMYQKTQTSVTNSIKNQRREVSEPDVNEEFINLIKYQQAYQAAAKIISTLDGIYETTIFRLGSF
jgi:flagellar hook-associated protein 1 FlgK